jgi:hypothetical protein
MELHKGNLANLLLLVTAAVILVSQALSSYEESSAEKVVLKNCGSFH